MRTAFLRIAAVACGVGLMGGAAWLAWGAPRGHAKAHRPAAALVYSPQGFGGYVPATSAPMLTPHAAPSDPLGPVLEAYASGRYGAAQSAAEKLARVKLHAPAAADRKQGVRADLMAAYAMARQHNFEQAREWFGKTREDAAALPDHGKRPARLGENPPTLEEEAAYQHAVCTGALGERAGAKREYVAFMREYPESALVHGAIKRITWLNGGNIPADAEETWKAAMRVAKARTETREREQSLCGPECLAELLRRRGEKASVLRLADQMKTTHEGTSVQGFADAAKRHGFAARGLMLTAKGLEQQKLPLVALVAPGHYVLVEAAGPQGVRVWDPDAKGTGKPAARQMSPAKWASEWDGVAVALR